MSEKQIALLSAYPLASLEDGIRTIEQYARLASEQGIQVLCTPEAYLTGYGTDQASLARAVRANETAPISSLAARYHIDILAGFLENAADGTYYISHGIYRADGTSDIYRKTHLGQKEQTVFAAGNALPVFELSCGICAGISLCVENHFPEIAQTLSLRGAEVIFAPFAVPGEASGRDRIWRKYIPARGYDNRVYMACCNLKTAANGGGFFAAGPDGEELPLRDLLPEELVSVSVSREMIEKYRTGRTEMRYRYYPALRRPSLYEEP